MTALPDGFAVECNFEGVGDDVLIFGDAPRGKFGTGTFGGAAAFVDVTAYVRSGSITRGVTRFEGVYGRAEAGTAQVVLSNADARFDPSNLAGPYVAAGETQVEPMRAWRIRVGAVDLWRGFADSWDLDYPLGGKEATCTLRGTDGTKVMAGFNGPSPGSAGAGETTGARIGRVLDNAGWPAADRDLDTGQLVVEATTLAQPAWTEIVLTSDTELGEVYFDPQGKIVFRQQQAIMSEERSTTPQGVFDKAPSTDLGYVALRVATDDTLLANLVRIGGPAVAEQVVEDAASQVKYLTRSFVRTDLIMRTNAVALAYAEYVLYLLKDVELRFESITLDPRSDPDDLYPQALGRELGDRITVRWTPPGGAEVERDCFIRGIAHTFDPATWITTWTLQDATRFNYLILDHAERGLLDANRLAF